MLTDQEKPVSFYLITELVTHLNLCNEDNNLTSSGEKKSENPYKHLIKIDGKTLFRQLNFFVSLMANEETVSPNSR